MKNLQTERTESRMMTAVGPARGQGRGGVVEGRGEFLHRLESLRGVAALMVAGWHSFAVLVCQDWQGPVVRLARMALNGHAAVTLFFVLSGLVLGFSLSRGKGPFLLDYTAFALRRFFRICPAFGAATFTITAAILWLDMRIVYAPGISEWFAAHWSEPFTLTFFLENLFFLDDRLNPPTWTLCVELVCSLSLPLLFFLSRHGGWLKRGILLGGLITWSLYRDGRLSAWLFMFYLGFLLPAAGSALMQMTNRTRLARWIAPLSWVLLCVSVDLFAGHKSWGRLLEGVSATVFISALLYGPELAWFRILDRAPTRFYGRISYSFYLYHMVSLYFVSKTAFRLFPVSTLVNYAIVSGILLLLFSTALATSLAWASHRFVEEPGTDFSKNLCRLITDRFLSARVAVGTGERVLETHP